MADLKTIIAGRWHRAAFLRVDIKEENLKAPSSVVTLYFLIKFLCSQFIILSTASRKKKAEESWRKPDELLAVISGLAGHEKLVQLLWFQCIPGPWWTSLTQVSLTVQTISVPEMVVLRDGIARGDVPCHISGNFCYVTWEKRQKFCRDFLKSKWLILSGFESFSLSNAQGLEKTSAEFWQNHEHSWSYLYNWLPCLFSEPTMFFRLVLEQGTQIK